MEAREIANRYNSEMKRMKTVTERTDFETGATVCEIDNEKETRHITPVVVGRKTSVNTPGCDYGGERNTTIHSHPSQPPSKQDLINAKEEDSQHCIVLSKAEKDQSGISIGEDKAGMLMCYEGDENSNPDEAFRVPEDGNDHIKKKDVERLQDAGYRVSVSNL